jgi:hypothetical protein
MEHGGNNMNDMDFQLSDKETIEALNANLEHAYSQIEQLGQIVRDQDRMIQTLKDRLKANNIYFLEKSIVETTREELAKINSCIPESRTKKAFGVRTKQPTWQKEEELANSAAKNGNEYVLAIIESITKDVDLDKYGIDPVTLNFKAGYGPSSMAPTPPVKFTLFQKMRKALKF